MIESIQYKEVGEKMLALEGYYDGENVQTLEKIHAQKNQKLIITILDEFIEEKPKERIRQTAKGILSKYADPLLQAQEDTAWENAVVKRYDNA
ncbi:MAG: hypothetical protein NC314_01160 [Roseburia sp.]|nr:hypothetical protein [Roseburia sp.]MCM1241422.1 hypothetical protein [Roseburia sp.]